MTDDIKIIYWFEMPNKWTFSRETRWGNPRWVYKGGFLLEEEKKSLKEVLKEKKESLEKWLK